MTYVKDMMLRSCEIMNKKELKEKRDNIKYKIDLAKIGYSESVLHKEKYQYKQWYNDLQKQLKSTNKRIALIESYTYYKELK